MIERGRTLVLGAALHWPVLPRPRLAGFQVSTEGWRWPRPAPLRAGGEQGSRAGGLGVVPAGTSAHLHPAPSEVYVEQMEMGLFLEAYEEATSRRLELAWPWWESPDFVCRRESGELIGVELTKVTRDPSSRVSDAILGRDVMDVYDVLDGIAVAIAKKEGKRQKWAFPHGVILVIQVCDHPVSDLVTFLEDLGTEEFADHGFEEIYLADHSELDAYQQVELFGLSPESAWGYYERDRGKPYG